MLYDDNVGMCREGYFCVFYIYLARFTSFSRSTKVVQCASEGSVDGNTNTYSLQVHTLFHLARGLRLSFREEEGM